MRLSLCVFMFAIHFGLVLFCSVLSNSVHRHLFCLPFPGLSSLHHQEVGIRDGKEKKKIEKERRKRERKKDEGAKIQMISSISWSGNLVRKRDVTMSLERKRGEN